ncbi:MAG: hypothetical protein NVSMB29_03080 [Candidatus Dormibacteria bacterium]
MAEWLEAWLEDVASSRPHSHADYAQKMRKHVLPHLGRVPLDQLMPEHIASLRTCLGNTALQPASQRTVLAVFKAALHEAEEQGLLACSPMAPLALPRTTAKHRGVLSRRDCQRLVSTARRDDDIGVLVLLALTTGARQGKLLPLTWDDVDWESGTLALSKAVRRDLHGRPTVEPQVNDEQLRVSPGVLTALRRHQARQRERRAAGQRARRETGLVFASRTGTLLDRSHLLDRYYALLAQAKCPRVHFRDLRHACDHAFEAPLRATA